MLEWLVECEATPPELGMNELINSWEDWVPSPLVSGNFPAPVFTAIEQELIRKVSSALDVFCLAAPGSIKDEQAALRLPEWVAVISITKQALSSMIERERMSEEQEL